MGMYALWMQVTADEAADPDALGAAAFDMTEEDDRPQFDVDKMWHGLHAVLTGNPSGDDHPLDDVTWGGIPIGDDWGYGPPRLLAQAEVAALAEQLDALDRADVERRIDLHRLAELEIYPTVIWDRPEEATLLHDELLDAFDTVRTGFRAAADAGASLVLVIT